MLIDNFWLRYLPNKKRVNDNSKRPHINFIGMSIFSFEDFRRNIIGRTTNGFLLFTFEFNLRGKAKITKLENHVITKEEVSEFEISMDDLIRVEVLECVNDLEHVDLRFEFRDALTSLDEFVERLVRAELEKNVHVFCVFENMFELHDVLVMETLMDFDFRNQLDTLSLLRECRLRDDLPSKNDLRLLGNHLVALRETTATKQFTSRVLLQCCHARFLVHRFLLDYLHLA